MKLRRQHLHGIAHVITNALHATGMAKAPLPAIEERIQALLEQDMAAERALEEEAQRLLNQQLRQHLGKMGTDIDTSRAFQLIKRELAKKRGVIL